MNDRSGSRSSFFLVALGSVQIYLQPASSLGVASFLSQGEVVFTSESRELQLPLPVGGCGCAPFYATSGSSSQMILEIFQRPPPSLLVCVVPWMGD